MGQKCSVFRLIVLSWNLQDRQHAALNFLINILRFPGEAVFTLIKYCPISIPKGTYMRICSLGHQRAWKTRRALRDTRQGREWPRRKPGGKQVAGGDRTNKTDASGMSMDQAWLLFTIVYGPGPLSLTSEQLFYLINVQSEWLTDGKASCSYSMLSRKVR